MALYEIKVLIPINLVYHTFSSSNNEDFISKNCPNVSFSVSTDTRRGHVSILNLGGQKNFLPSNRIPIGTFFKILLSKSQKLRGPLPPLPPSNVAPESIL